MLTPLYGIALEESRFEGVLLAAAPFISPIYCVENNCQSVIIFGQISRKVQLYANSFYCNLTPPPVISYA